METRRTLEPPQVRQVLPCSGEVESGQVLWFATTLVGDARWGLRCSSDVMMRPGFWWCGCCVLPKAVSVWVGPSERVPNGRSGRAGAISRHVMGRRRKDAGFGQRDGWLIACCWLCLSILYST